MMAGLVLLSAFVGTVAVIGALALSVPFWTAMLIYPTICSLSLLLTAAFSNIRAVQRASATGLVRSQA